MDTKTTQPHTFIENNRGSSIVLVMITMFVVALLGAIVLYLSFTGLEISATEQYGAQSFYDTSELMDLVKAGIGEASSDAAAQAYAEVLSLEYATEEAAKMDFNNRFVNYLLAWEPEESRMALTYTGGSLNLQVISLFLTKGGVPQDSISIFNNTKAIGITGGSTSEILAEEGTVLFKALTITYLDPETKMQNVITTDFLVQAPIFANAGNTTFDFSDSVEFALIAREALVSTIPAVSPNTVEITVDGNPETRGGNTVDGNVYANEWLFSSNRALLGGTQPESVTLLQNGTVILAEAMQTTNHGVYLQADGQLWANDILLDRSGLFSLSGAAYVANDLNLQGQYGTALLSGSYYGFGNGLITGSTAVTAPQSSAILLNHINTTLDLTKSNLLMLAGHSFILDQEGVTGLMMGESVATRFSQTAYLVPHQHLNSTPELTITGNPLFTDHTIEQLQAMVTLDRTEPLFVVDGQAKTFADYGASLAIRQYTVPGMTDRVSYFFLEFSDVDGKTAEQHANQYFRDYFTANKEDLTPYLDSYHTLSSVGGEVLAAANYIEKVMVPSAENPAVLVPDYILSDVEDQVDQLNSAVMQELYDNLTETLSEVDSEGKDPYEYLTTAEDGTSTVENFTTQYQQNDNIWSFTDGDGDVVAIFVDNESAPAFALNTLDPDDGRYNDVKLVLATGDVTLASNYQGLIIAGGQIDIEGFDVTADPLAVEEAMKATCTGTQLDVTQTTDVVLFHTLLGALDVESPKDQATGVSDSWALSNMVRYHNWKKL